MTAYEKRVQQLETEGCTTSDAQSVADCEVLEGKLIASRKEAIEQAFAELAAKKGATA